MKQVGNGGLNYASSISYFPTGPVSSLTLGNLMTEAWTLGTAQKQPTQLVASGGAAGLTASWTWGYGADNTDNGNVMSVGINGNGLSNVGQAFGYDHVNRLSGSGETGSPVPWTRNHVYDAWGNGWVSSWSGITPSSFTPMAQTNFDANNRLLIQGSTYDGAGNQTAIGGFTNTYDAENRQTKSVIGGVTTTYTYDGDGRRVQKVTGSTTVVYVYDAMGVLAAEYDSAAVQPSTCGTCYLTADTLGSTRMITDETGTPRECHDYLPFGEEIGRASAGGCYATTTSNTLKFTGKERDVETGLDWFSKRYFGSPEGRFTSPDPLIPFNLKKEKFRAWIANPQHWNKYAYALNNPLIYTDPSGMTETIDDWLNSSMTDEQKKYFQEHKTEILGAVADKLKAAGIKDVVFKEGSTLTKSQISSMLSSEPKGVAFLNFTNKSYAGHSADPSEYGATGGLRSAVFVGNLQTGDPSAGELSFRVSEVASHELGHRMGFYSRSATMSFVEFWNRDLMNEGQGVPSSSSPRQFDMSIPQNRQTVDEINKLPEYTPPQ